MYVYIYIYIHTYIYNDCAAHYRWRWMRLARRGELRPSPSVERSRRDALLRVACNGGRLDG